MASLMNCRRASIRMQKEEKERMKKSYEIERARHEDVSHTPWSPRCRQEDVGDHNIETSPLGRS
jgi:hypothetical protein